MQLITGGFQLELFASTALTRAWTLGAGFKYLRLRITDGEYEIQYSRDAEEVVKTSEELYPVTEPAPQLDDSNTWLSGFYIRLIYVY
jgi:hypothetical protein